MVLGLRGFPDVQGGVEKHAEELYPRLVQSGCKVAIIARSQYIPRDQETWKGITFHRIWAPRISGIEAFVHSIFGVLYAAIRRPDILHIHAIGPAIVTPLARILRLRVVVTHHGPDYDREKWRFMARCLLRLGEKWGMKYSNQRIVISNVINALIERKYSIETVVIPNGITLPQIPTSTFTLDNFNLDKGRYVLLVSRFVPEKRHLDLINAFNEANLKDWKLVLVGDADHPNEYSENIITTSKKLPNIVLTGYQSGLSLAELYAYAGIFVLPSSHEGLPIALLEALSYGIPVLASDIPANLEVGLSPEQYFHLGDVPALAHQLQKSVYIKPADNKFKETREWVCKRYNWADVAHKTLIVFKECV